MKHVQPFAPSASRLFLMAALTLAAAGCAHNHAQSPHLAPAAPATPAAPGALADAAPRITVYPSNLGQWRDLGVDSAPWLAGEMPVPVIRAATRAVGLRDAKGRWLAVLVAQAAPAQGAGCTALESLRVPNGRSSCLRMRRDALFDHYLQRQNPVLWDWLKQRGIARPPAAWVAARVPDGQRLLEVHALLEPSLLEAVTRSNDDFINAGHAGVQWARQLARAAQAAANGQALAVPPFPFAPAPQDAEPAEPPAEIIPTTANAAKARPAEAAKPAAKPAAEAATPPATQAEQVFERKERITAPAAEH